MSLSTKFYDLSISRNLFLKSEMRLFGAAVIQELFFFRNKPDERETNALIERHQARQEVNEADQLAIALINTSDFLLRLKCLIFKTEFEGRDVQEMGLEQF